MSDDLKPMPPKRTFQIDATVKMIGKQLPAPLSSTDLTPEDAPLRYAHMCRADHEEIGFNDEAERYDESCPLCEALAELARLREENAELRARLAGKDGHNG